MSEISERYQSGQIVNGSEWQKDYTTFGTIAWEDFVKDGAKVQLHLFDSDTDWQKVHPIEPEPTFEQKHLSRPTELKSGVTYTITSSFDSAYEQMRITKVREELQHLKEAGRL